MSENYKTFFVVNPHSAGGRTGREWEKIKSSARSLLGEFEFELTKGTGDAIELTRRALKSGYEMVVSVGGDGTNNEVLNGFFEQNKLINPDAVLGIVCSGTGSDFIKTAKIERDYKLSIKRLVGKAFRYIDIGLLRFIDHSGKEAERYFINIASFGVGGHTDALVNKSRKIVGGKITFLMATFRAGLFFKNQLVALTLDDELELERRIFNLAVANGRYFGAGMCVAPMAELSDGWFEVVILGDLKIPERLRVGSLIHRGGHLRLKKVEHFRAKKLKAETNETVLLDVDGEQPGKLPAEFELKHRAIRLKCLENEVADKI